ncbi:MAG: MFS transporter [Gammaproteobacteria bacterium]|nr:MFS transporter [Gammaproteobacteria bacterium]
MPLPYWRLSNFYLFYFASLGALLPYWGLYLKDEGYSALEIGELMALVMATKIISPNIWGWIADHTGHKMTIIRTGSLFSILCFAGVFWAEGYWVMALVMFSFSFFWNATLPQFEAVTLNYLHGDSHRYSLIRVWGSIGFIVTAVVLGPLFEWISVAHLPAILLGIYIAIFLSSGLVPEQNREPVHHEHLPLIGVLKQPRVIALLVVCFLMQASHGPYYTFFTLYMEGYGYSRTVIGELWGLGVIAEVLLFMVMHRLVPKFGLERLLIFALLITSLRWLVTALYADSLVVILLAQLIHAASFGIFHAVTIAMFHHHFPGKLQGRGQALYSSVSFGAGGAFGSYAGGLSWDQFGPESIYLFASLMTITAYLIAQRWFSGKSNRAQ